MKPNPKYLEKYQRHAKLLRANPDLIRDHWLQAIGLFSFCGQANACPTLIKHGFGSVYRSNGRKDIALTKMVQKQKLPQNVWDIKAKNLNTFAKIQALVDAVRSRKDRDKIAIKINEAIESALNKGYNSF